jgi:acetyl esterase/lipase
MKREILASLFLGSCLAVAPLRAQEPALDPQMKTVLDAYAALEPKPLERLSPEEARKEPGIDQAVARIMKAQGKTPEEVGTIVNSEVNLGSRVVKVRIYTPKGDGPFPVILYVHGGGWVVADLDTYDATPRALCNGAGAVVVSTHYRQAPEFKFPAAHEDVFGVYEWVLRNAVIIKGDPKRVAVVGESAGGNMAAAISLTAQEKRIPVPVYQVLIYPVADMSGTITPSKKDYVQARPLNTAMLDWFGKNLLSLPEEGKNPRLSLLLAGPALKGMPPTTIILAEIDPLRSDGESLAEALRAAGVKVKAKSFTGVTHEFFGMGAVLDKAKEAQALAAAELKSAFAP